jgi:anti-anti-sigma factor
VIERAKEFRDGEGTWMEISDEAVGDVRVVTARGRLDGSASGPFGEQVAKLIGSERPKLLIDFAGVDFVSSAGLRAVLTLLKKIKAGGGLFALCGVQAPVREVLDITGFTGMIDIHPERAAALEAMG